MRLTSRERTALYELLGALNAPVVERQEEAYNSEDTVHIEEAAREVMAAFSMMLAVLGAADTEEE